MSRINLVPATEAHIIYLEDNLRKADFEEFVMATGRNPKGVMRLGVAASDNPQVGLIDGVPACVFGVTPMDGHAAPWLLGTDALAGRLAAVALVRHGRRLFRRWAAEYGLLKNRAYATNDLHLRYLVALGCEVGPPEPTWPLNAMFREFIFREPTNVLCSWGD